MTDFEIAQKHMTDIRAHVKLTDDEAKYIEATMRCAMAQAQIRNIHEEHPSLKEAAEQAGWRRWLK